MAPDPLRSHRAPTRSPWLAVVGTVLVLVALVTFLARRPAETSSLTVRADATEAPATAAAPTRPAAPRTTRPTEPDPDPVRRPARPTRVVAPSIGVDAPMVALGLTRSGVIEVPDDGVDVGWVESTPVPGDQGPAVLAGHVDTRTGPAVFVRLHELQPGDPVAVTRSDGTTARFRVDGVRTYPRDRFPARRVYAPVPGPALRLITCGGVYDEDRGYTDNVVVYAS